MNEEGWLIITPKINRYTDKQTLKVSPVINDSRGEMFSIRVDSLYTFLFKDEAEQIYEHLKKELGK